jgi:alkane 1-monooxygenase
MPAYTYLSALLVSCFSLLGFMWGGLWAFAFPAVIFGLVPLLELVIKPDSFTHEKEELKARAQQRVFEWIVWLVIPMHYLCLFVYLSVVGRGVSLLDWVGMTLSMGLMCGAYGINVAHELGHRSNERARFGSKALLLTSLYMHFFIEHNRGHHARVATAEDPASAREGESVYQFWWRSTIGGFRSAWELEARRLSRHNVGAWSLKNQALRFILIQCSFIGSISLFFGAIATISFVISALIGALLLETVNYIEHYGLSREPKARGGYEPVKPIHSWNSDHQIGRALLFELSRHSDHHANPKRVYATLRHHPQSLQLPTGYPGMILFALVPSVFMPYMSSYIRRERDRLADLSPQAS